MCSTGYICIVDAGIDDRGLSRDKVIQSSLMRATTHGRREGHMRRTKLLQNAATVCSQPLNGGSSKYGVLRLGRRVTRLRPPCIQPEQERSDCIQSRTAIYHFRVSRIPHPASSFVVTRRTRE